MLLQSKNMNHLTFSIIDSVNPSPVTTLTFSPDGSSLVYANRNNEVIIWDLEADRVSQRIQFSSNGTISNILLKPNSIWVVGENIFSLYNIKTDEVVNLIPYTCGDVHTLSSNGEMVAVTQLQHTYFLLPKEDPILVIQSVVNGFEVDHVITNEEICRKAFLLRLYEMAFSPDNEKIAALIEINQDYYGWENRLYIWEIGRELDVYWWDPVPGNTALLTFSPKGDFLAFWNEETREITLLSLNENVQSKWFYGVEERVLSLAFIQDGRLFASGGQDQKLRIWDLVSDKLIYTHQCDSSVTAIAFSPDSRKIAVGGESGRIVIGDFSEHL